MAQFLVLAYDGTDADAVARRRAARPAHFEALQPMVARGEIVIGGAILDTAGTMIGSTVIAEFPSRAELDAWLAREPYMTQGVWRKVEIQPVRLAVREGKVTP
jgi:uncharacterized protein YciI